MSNPGMHVQIAPRAGPACQAPCPALLDVAVGKTKVGPIPTSSPVLFLSGHGNSARSSRGKSPNSVRVPPLEFGTVTKAKVGRTNCVNGRNAFGRIRGMSGL